MTKPNSIKRKSLGGKDVVRPLVLAQSYRDLQERLRAEEAEWAWKCGPVTVRKAKKK